MGNRVWIKVVVWATLISMIVSTLLMGVSFFGA
ncbi:stressosome-associated protein Prli42 [Paenibacillus sp.]|nr:stressosome-associated protein Prli42 [Paenibacillus sp.]HZG85155.1 stressosome-associated protein Prli42 [Paenibacillus sp.]